MTSPRRVRAAIRSLHPLSFSSLLLLSAAAPVAAQSALTVGIKGGQSFSTATVELPELDEIGISIDPNWRVGLTGGLFFGRSLRGNLGIRSEVLVTQKGITFDLLGLDEEVRLTYLEIPVLASWTTRTSDTVTAHVVAGPSFGFRLSEIQKEEGEVLEIEDQTRPFDFGLAVGGGVEVNRVVIDARFTLGLVNVADPEQLGAGASARNRSFSVTIGWRLK